MKDFPEEGQKDNKNHYELQKLRIFLLNLSHKSMISKMSSESSDYFL